MMALLINKDPDKTLCLNRVLHTCYLDSRDLIWCQINLGSDVSKQTSG